MCGWFFWLWLGKINSIKFDMTSASWPILDAGGFAQEMQFQDDCTRGLEYKEMSELLVLRHVDDLV